jgi:hypothetical protein
VFLPCGFIGENRQDNGVMIPLRTIQGRYPDAETVVLYCQARPGLRDIAFNEVEAASLDPVDSLRYE